MEKQKPQKPFSQREKETIVLALQCAQNELRIHIKEHETASACMSETKRESESNVPPNFPKIDYNELATKLGVKNRETACAMWNAIKRKIGTNTGKPRRKTYKHNATSSSSAGAMAGATSGAEDTIMVTSTSTSSTTDENAWNSQAAATSTLASNGDSARHAPTSASAAERVMIIEIKDEDDSEAE